MKAMYQASFVVDKTHTTATLVIAAVVCVLFIVAVVTGALLWRKHKVRIHACAKQITYELTIK